MTIKDIELDLRACIPMLKEKRFFAVAHSIQHAADKLHHINNELQLAKNHPNTLVATHTEQILREIGDL